MKFITQPNLSLSDKINCLLVGVFTNKKLTTTEDRIIAECQQLLKDLFASGDLTGEVGQTYLIHQTNLFNGARIMFVGCGEQCELSLVSQKDYSKIINNSLQALKQKSIQSVYDCLTCIQIKDHTDDLMYRLTVQHVHDALYRFDQFKSKSEPEYRLEDWIFCTDKTTISEQGITQGMAISEGIRDCKNVANMPPNIANPSYLAEQALALAKTFPSIKTEVIGEAEMETLGMHSYLAVGRGSEHESKMSLIHYNGAADKNAQPIVIVGKGLTFDAGGISIKPSEGMDEMKYDMGGAAAVLGTMKAVAMLDLPVNVIGVVAGCENMPDGNAYRPGDILTTMSGQTVEVLNTDAEGRLVLCDALTYVERFKPACVIDIATLTGACVIALGHHISGLLGNNEQLTDEILLAGKQSTDHSWLLPLTEEYTEQLKSPFADLANIGGRPAGTITAAAFLSHFTKKYEWAHLDIAGTAWKSGAQKGATGRPTALLSQFIINRCQTN